MKITDNQGRPIEVRLIDSRGMAGEPLTTLQIQRDGEAVSYHDIKDTLPSHYRDYLRDTRNQLARANEQAALNYVI